MGEGVLRSLKNITSLHNHKVEQARFMVLKSPDIPSILIETGFISNPREESNLTNPGYQARLSQSIFQGLKQYFWDYPPHGPQVANVSAHAPIHASAPSPAHASTTIHVVHSGESLTKIAAKYKVSPAALLAANHMTGSMVKIGQRLVVPSPLS
jgi:N-acetylmuramoyl-L-alanine amidase